MPKTRIPSPSRSQGSNRTPRRSKPRGSRSVCSPALSNASGRLTSIIDEFKDKHMESFSISPMKSRWSVLTDNTDIEMPQRKSWWKNLDENSQDFIEVLEDNKATDSNNPVEEVSDIEIISQENKDYSSLDLPESSDNESIQSLVITQRKLFTQKENKPQKKFGQLVGTRETLTKLHKSNTTFHEKTITAGTKDLFQGTKKTKPVFSAALLNMSANKTGSDKTTESVAEPRIPVKNIFGNRPAKKRKNIFADFIVSDSEHEVSDIQVQGKQNMMKRTKNDKTQEKQADEGQKMVNENSAKVNHEERVNQKDNESNECEVKEINKYQKAYEKVYENQELNQPQKELHHYGSRESLDKLHIVNITHDEDIVTAGTKDLFQANKGSNIVFSSTLLHVSPNKTVTDKTEGPVSELKTTAKNLFGNGALNKHRNIFADFLESESEHEISEIVPEKEESTAAETADIHKKQENQVEAISTIGAEKSLADNQEGMVGLTEDKDNVTEKDKDINPAQNVEDKVIDSEKEEEGDNESEEGEEMKYEESDEELPDVNTNRHEECFDNKRLAEINKSQEEINKIEEVNHESKSICQRKSNKSVLETIEGDKEKENHKQNEPNKKNVTTNVIQEVVDEMNDYQHSNQNEQDKQTEIQQNNNKSKYDKNDENNHIDALADKSEKGKHRDNYSKQSDDDEKGSSKISSKANESLNDSEDKKMDESIDADKVIPTNDVLEQDDEGEMEVDHYENGRNNEVDDKRESNIIYDEEENDMVDGETENKTVENELDDDNEENEEADIENELGDEENEAQHHHQSKAIDENEESEVNNDINEDIEIAYGENNDETEDTEVDDEENEHSEENKDDEEIEYSQANKDDEEIEENEDAEVDDEGNEDTEGDDGESVENEDTEGDDGESVENEDIEMDEDENEDDDEPENIDEEESEETSQVRSKVVPSDEVIEESPNVTHDTTGRNRKKIKSPEVVLHDKTKQQSSFIAKGRNTSIRETKTMYKDLDIRPSLAPPRDSIGLSAGDSSAEGSGWDSHRTTRKTLRQTFGKDFTPRKSLRALVMEKSAKQTVNVQALQSETVLLPQANSTEFPQDSNSAVDVTIESDHEVSIRTRQTTLETYLQKIKQQNVEKKLKMEQAIRDSLKATPIRDTLSLFKVPSIPPRRRPKPITNKPKKQIKSTLFDELPSEVIEDMKYKPPKRFQPSNASWITKRLYKFLESKLEPKYDYKARVRAEKLVETIYHFAKDLRRHDVAPVDAVDVLKHELARLEIVKTHFEFYEFFHEFMPREVRVKVVPDIVNKIPLPRHGVFADILRVNTVQG